VSFNRGKDVVWDIYFPTVVVGVIEPTGDAVAKDYGIAAVSKPTCKR
jgi:hypothetical protein